MTADWLTIGQIGWRQKVNLSLLFYQSSISLAGGMTVHIQGLLKDGFYQDRFLINIRSPGQINTTILSIFWISTFCGLSMTTTPPEFPHRRMDPLDPRSYPQGGSKFTQSQIYYTKLTLWPCIRFHLDFNPRWFLTYNLTYLRSSSFRLDLGPKNGPKLGQKCQKFRIFKKVKNVKCLVFQLII